MQGSRAWLLGSHPCPEIVALTGIVPAAVAVVAPLSASAPTIAIVSNTRLATHPPLHGFPSANGNENAAGGSSRGEDAFRECHLLVPSTRRRCIGCLYQLKVVLPIGRQAYSARRWDPALVRAARAGPPGARLTLARPGGRPAG